MNECTRNISYLIDLSRKLLFCADRGDIQRKDDTCGVLYGMTRDCAYKILDLTIKERSLHIMKGTWGKDDDTETNST